MKTVPHDVAIKLNWGKNPGYFLDISRKGIETVSKKEDAKRFSHPSKAKLEILRLIIDHRIPRALIEIREV